MTDTDTNNTFEALSRLPKGLAPLKSHHVRAPLQQLGHRWIELDESNEQPDENTPYFYKTDHHVHSLFIAETTTLRQGLPADANTLDLLGNMNLEDDTFKISGHRRYIMPIKDINLRSSHIGILIAESKDQNWSFTYIDPKRPSMMTRRIRQQLRDKYPSCQFRAIETNQQALLDDTTCGYHMLSNIEAVLTLMDDGKSPEQLTAANIRHAATTTFTQKKDGNDEVVVPLSSAHRAIRKHELDIRHGFDSLPFRFIISRAFDDTYNLKRYVDQEKIHDDYTKSDYLMGRKEATKTHRVNALFDLPTKAPQSIGDWFAWIIRSPIIFVNNFILKPLISVGRMNDLALQSSIQDLKVMSVMGASLGMAAVSFIQLLNRVVYDGLRLIATPLDALQTLIRRPLYTLRSVFLPLGQSLHDAFDVLYYVHDYQVAGESSAAQHTRAFFEWTPFKANTKTGRFFESIGKSLYTALSLPFNIFKLTLTMLKAIQSYTSKKYSAYRQHYQPLFAPVEMLLGEPSHKNEKFRDDKTFEMHETYQVDQSAVITRRPLPIFNALIGKLITVSASISYEAIRPAMAPKNYWRESWVLYKNHSERSKYKAVGHMALRTLRFIGSNILLACAIGAALPTMCGAKAIAHASKVIVNHVPKLSKLFNALGLQSARLSGQTASATLAGALASADVVASTTFQGGRRAISTTTTMTSEANKPLLDRVDEDEFDIVFSGDDCHDSGTTPASHATQRPQSPSSGSLFSESRHSPVASDEYLQVSPHSSPTPST